MIQIHFFSQQTLGVVGLSKVEWLFHWHHSLGRRKLPKTVWKVDKMGRKYPSKCRHNLKLQRSLSTQVGCLKTLTVWEVWLQSQMLNVNQVGGWMHEAIATEGENFSEISLNSKGTNFFENNNILSLGWHTDTKQHRYSALSYGNLRWQPKV